MRLVLGLALFTIVCSLPAASAARPGTLDPSFGQGGIVTANKSGPGAGAYPIALEIQSDGKILAGGGNQIVRYLPDGGLDTTYGDGGAVTSSVPVQKMALLPGDALLIGTGVGGAVTLARYLSDGTLDASFGSGGVQTTTLLDTINLNAIAVQPDGKILLAAAASLSVVRLHPDGSVDTAFGNAGLASNPVADLTAGMVLQADGAIVVGGIVGPGTMTDLVLTRYDTNGVVDPSFGTGGVVVTDPLVGGSDNLSHLVLQPDGVIAVAQTLDVNHEYWFVMVRYVNGTVDPFFGVNGVAQVNFHADGAPADAYTFPWASHFDDQGRLVVVGRADIGGLLYARPFAMARLEPSGTIDATFGTGGKVLTRLPAGGTGESLAVAVTADQRIVVAGSYYEPTKESSSYNTARFALARYDGGGSDLPTCPHTHDYLCHEPTGGKATLVIKNNVSDRSDKLTWQWTGAIVSDFGDPTSTDVYALCLYEESDGLWPPLRYAAGASAAGTCGGKPCWKASGGGFTYRSATGAPMGILGLKLQQKGGKTKLALKGHGVNLGGMTLVPLSSPFLVQLRAGNGECWSSTLYTSPLQNDGAHVKAVTIP
jgi:uncharacterized delta-60 repeat protein